MANTGLGFYHLSGALSTISAPEVGTIYFSSADHTIGVGTASGMEKYYGGNVANAVYADKKLTITYNDGSAQAVLDFSDVASAEGVSSLLSDLRKDVNALKTASHSHENGTVLDGITSDKVSAWDAVAGKKSDYDSHVADSDIHVTTEDKATWSGKQDALSADDLARIAAVDDKADATDVDALEKYVKGDSKDGNGGLEKRIADLEGADVQDALTDEQLAAVNSGIDSTKVGNYDAHVANTYVHITNDERTAWDAYATSKQDALSSEDLARIAAVDSKANSADLGTAAAKDVLDGSIADSTSNDLVTAAQVKAYAAGVVGAMHFRGAVASTDAVENPVSGDICLVGTKEYVYDGSNWALFGDEGAYEAAGTAQGLIDNLAGEASSTSGADVVVTVSSSKGEVSSVSVDSSVLSGRVAALENADSKNVTAEKIAAWDAVAAKKSDYDSHIADADIHVTADDKAAWNSKAAGDHNHDDVYDAKGAAATAQTAAEAYADSLASNYDEAGAAATAKSDVIGKDGDASAADTIYGAKKYADEAAANAVSQGLIWKAF